MGCDFSVHENPTLCIASVVDALCFCGPLPLRPDRIVSVEQRFLTLDLPGESSAAVAALLNELHLQQQFEVTLTVSLCAELIKPLTTSHFGGHHSAPAVFAVRPNPRSACGTPT